MAVIHFDRDLSGDMVDQIITRLGTAATISFYNGSQPALTTTGITDQLLLGVCACANPIGSESGGTLTFSPIGSDLEANNSGTATWVRIRDGASKAWMDLDVGVTGSTAYVQMASTSITAGGPLAFNSFTITMP